MDGKVHSPTTGACWSDAGILISHDEGIEVIRSLRDVGGVDDCLDTNARRCRYRKLDR